MPIDYRKHIIMMEASRVHSSEWKREGSQRDHDIVTSAWRHAAELEARIVINDYNGRQRKKNEVTHISIFVDIINRFKEDYPNVWNDSLVTRQLQDMVDSEIKYNKYLIDPKNMGFSSDNITRYIKHRANSTFRSLGLEFRYEDVSNPFLHLERVSNVENVDSTETGIFEAHSTNYFDPSVKLKDFKEFAHA